TTLGRPLAKDAGRTKWQPETTVLDRPADRAVQRHDAGATSGKNLRVQGSARLTKTSTGMFDPTGRPLLASDSAA
ncbi:MAG: hypothetical protein AB7N65_05395, partial [Vicinamibacterales bacterium]